jgi:hypothetical protein
LPLQLIQLVTMNVREEIVVHDICVLIQNGKVVAQVSARIDLSEVPPDLREWISVQRLEKSIPSVSDMERAVWIAEWFRLRNLEYLALPWWMKIIRRKPRPWDYL